MGWLNNLGQTVDAVSTAMKWPELNVSEMLNGGPTANTGGSGTTSSPYGGSLDILGGIEQQVRNADTTSASAPTTTAVTSQPAPTAPASAPVYDAAAAAAAAAATAAAEARAKEVAQATRDVSLQSSYLDTARTGFNTTRDSISKLLADVLGGYDKEATRYTGEFNEQKNTNVGNYNRDMQSAMSNAARGRQGLFGQLAAMGALSGSGITLADQAVQTGANLDIGGATQEFGNNAQMLQGSMDQFKTEDEARRLATSGKATAMQTQAENQYNKEQRDIFVKMATLYNTLGNQSMADDYVSRAQALSQPIGQTQAAPVGGLDPISASFSPQALGNYMNQGVNDVSIAEGSQMPNGLLPSLMATIRRREQGA